MKCSGTLGIVILAFVGLAAVVQAQSPREQFQQMVDSLRSNPTDNALRERIIKLGAEMKPSPAIPEETERRMVRGATAFKNATSQAGFQAAVKEFEQAVLAAPWYGDAYFNLGMAQDKAGNLDAAMRSLKLAQMATPDSKEIKALTYELEYRQERANSPEARADKEKQAAQRFLAALDGTKYLCPEYRGDRDAWRVEIEIRNGKIHGDNVITWINPKLTPGVDYASNAYVGLKGYWFEDMPLQGRVNVLRAKYDEIQLELFEDRLTYVLQKSDRRFPPETCRRIK